MRRKSNNIANKSYLNPQNNLHSRKRQSFDAPNPSKFVSSQKSKKDHDLEAFTQLILRLLKCFQNGFFHRNIPFPSFSKYARNIRTTNLTSIMSL